MDPTFPLYFILLIFNCFFFWSSFQTRSPCIARSGLELKSLLPLSPGIGLCHHFWPPRWSISHVLHLALLSEVLIAAVTPSIWMLRLDHTNSDVTTTL